MIDEIHLHGRRAAWLAAKLCTYVGVPRHNVPSIAWAALNHDVGKYAIPSSILNKPASLTAEERLLMERHCVLGAEMLAEQAVNESLHFGKDAIAVALWHHEWWNGMGYPFGLEGRAIPQCARIVAVVDVFDALVSVRPYKQPWSITQAIDHIVRKRGVQFDPECVDGLVSIVGNLPRAWASKAEACLANLSIGGAAYTGCSAEEADENPPLIERCQDLPAMSTGTIALDLRRLQTLLVSQSRV